MSKKTPLFNAHQALGGKIVEFAGYDMPIQYKEGVIAEHEWTRSRAGLFDVSHMGQIFARGDGVAELFTKITPSSFLNVPDGRAKYTVLTNEEGGIIDDLIITKVKEGEFFAVLNAACKEKDIAWIKKHAPKSVEIEYLESRALIALQGAKAESALAKLVKNINLSELPYMTFAKANLLNGSEIFISRLGYTGEDGFEISIEGDQAESFWNKLLEDSDVKAVGLAARDSLRLEMGYPLYGHDIDAETSPIEADLGWVVAKTNDNFIGANRVLKEKSEGTSKKRVGIKLTDKGIAREGSEIYSESGERIGTLTSGSFSPSLKQSVGQGYLNSVFAKEGTGVLVRVRGRDIAARVENLPFIAPKTKSMKKQ